MYSRCIDNFMAGARRTQYHDVQEGESYSMRYKLRQFMEWQREGFLKLLRGASCHSEINSGHREFWFLLRWILSGHTWFSGSQIFWCCTHSEKNRQSQKHQQYTDFGSSNVACVFWRRAIHMLVHLQLPVSAQPAVPLVAFNTPWLLRDLLNLRAGSNTGESKPPTGTSR